MVTSSFDNSGRVSLDTSMILTIPNKKILTPRFIHLSPVLDDAQLSSLLCKYLTTLGCVASNGKTKLNIFRAADRAVVTCAKISFERGYNEILVNSWSLNMVCRCQVELPVVRPPFHL